MRIWLLRCLFRCWMKILYPGKVKTSQDFVVQVNKWEGWINTLKREVLEVVRIRILIHMAPDELRVTILDYVDRVREYREMNESMVTILDARGQLEDLDVMDVGIAEEEWEDQRGDLDLGVGGKNTNCYRCGAVGQIAIDCGTPKGKGTVNGDKGYVQGALKEYKK